MSVHIARDKNRTLCGRVRRTGTTLSADTFRRYIATGDGNHHAWCLTCTDTFWARERRRPDK